MVQTVPSVHVSSHLFRAPSASSGLSTALVSPAYLPATYLGRQRYIVPRFYTVSRPSANHSVLQRRPAPTISNARASLDTSRDRPTTRDTRPDGLNALRLTGPGNSDWCSSRNPSWPKLLTETDYSPAQCRSPESKRQLPHFCSRHKTLLIYPRV